MISTSTIAHSKTAAILRTLGMLLVVVVAASLAGCTPADEGVTPPARQPGVFDAAELETWADEFFEEQLDELKIPGAVFILVRDGEVVLAKGFGIADLELEIAPLLFQRVDGQELIAFREDALGNIMYMFTPETFEKID